MSIYGSTESVVFSNISATPTAFPLKGGQYALTVHATWGGGSVTLQRLAADAQTYITVLTAFTVDGFQTLDLPSGTYQLLVATATGIYADITSVIVTAL